jgi:hypothetical protein
MVLAHSRGLLCSQVNYIPFQIGIRLVNVHTRTKASKSLERLEDCVDLRSFLRSCSPALRGDPPDFRGNSWSIKAARLGRSFPLRDQKYEVGIRHFGKGYLSSYELGTNTIRTWTYRTFENQTRLHNNHRQGVHIRLLRWLSLLDPYGVSGIEEFRSTVTDSTAVVGG